ncbi:MAG: P-type conjugative transfer protein TrbL [Bryobacteraceae bacterium]
MRLLPILAQLPPISDPSDLTSIFEQMVGHWLGIVSPYAIEIFWALAALDIAVFGWNLWMHYGGDIRQAMLATANKLLIIGVFLALLMNGATWMTDIINDFITIGKSASGVPSLTPSMILLQGFKVFGIMFGKAFTSGLFLDIPTALALIVAGICICASFLVITFQFVITKLQTFLAIGIGYFFLGFGGSRWTAPYVERYFAFAVASGVKLMTLYLLVGGGWFITNTWVQRASQIGLSISAVEQAWAIACGSILYAGMCWFASSQISATLGGSPNLSHSDFVSFLGPMVSAGVTAGLVAAGVATGGTSAALGVAGAAVTTGAASASSGSGGSNPSGGSPPQPSASGSGGASVAAGVGQIVQAGVSAANRLPHSGSGAAPPHFNGFGH